MGAYADVTENTTRILEDKLPALEADLLTKVEAAYAGYRDDSGWTVERVLRRNIAYGYSSPRNMKPAKADTLPPGDTLRRINELLSQYEARWALEAAFDGRGGYHIAFTGEKCSGGEEELANMKLLAPYVTAGGVLAMSNEYGYHWRYEFDGAAVVCKEGTVTYR